MAARDFFYGLFLSAHILKDRLFVIVVAKRTKLRVNLSLSCVIGVDNVFLYYRIAVEAGNIT